MAAIPPLHFSGGAAGPSGANGELFDSSGWTVNLNSGQGTIKNAAGIDWAQWMPYILGAAVLVAWRMTRKS